jgi:hypothetical protein
MCNTILFLNYYRSNLSTYINQYTSYPPGRVGISVVSNVNIGELFNNFNENIGKIQFNNIDISTLTYPPLYDISEEIIIKLNDGSSIFALYNYKSNDSYYENGQKYIIPIVSCTGNFVGKKGYIVIDIVDDIRYITISLD